MPTPRKNPMRSFTRNARARYGLTLVEVLAVLVILGLIAGTLTIGFAGAFGQAQSEAARAAMGILINKVEAYKVSTGSYPDPVLGLNALTDGSAKPTDAYYLKPEQLIDPWKNPYIITIPGPNGHPFEITTLGSDGAPGGEGEAQDISSLNLRNLSP